MNRLIISLVLVALLGTACADVTGSAIEVNGESLDRADVLDLIEDLRSPASGDDPVRIGTPGDFEGCFARDLAVNESILNILVKDEIARLGGSVTAEDQVTGEGVAEVEIAERGRFTEDARDFIEDVVSAQSALGRLVETEDVGITIQRLIEDADVAIDSRFGDWVDGLGFVGIESSCTAG